MKVQNRYYERFDGQSQSALVHAIPMDREGEWLEANPGAVRVTREYAIKQGRKGLWSHQVAGGAEQIPAVVEIEVSMLNQRKREAKIAAVREALPKRNREQEQVRAACAHLVEEPDDVATWSELKDYLLDRGAAPRCGCARGNMESPHTNSFVAWDACQFLACTFQGRDAIEAVDFADHYAEPGYTDGMIALANWNVVSHYDGKLQCHFKLDDAPELLGKMLEALDFSLEWSDEWTRCDGCGGLLRSQPDSFHWRPAFQEVDGSFLCEHCYEEAGRPNDEPEPEEDDYITPDYVTFYQNRREVLRVREGESWEDAVREHMEGQQYWPSVWVEEERGGYHLATFGGAESR